MKWAAVSRWAQVSPRAGRRSRPALGAGLQTPPPRRPKVSNNSIGLILTNVESGVPLPVTTSCACGTQRLRSNLGYPLRSCRPVACTRWAQCSRFHPAHRSPTHRSCRTLLGLVRKMRSPLRAVPVFGTCPRIPRQPESPALSKH